MDWSAVGKRVISATPLLGTLLGGPAGAAVSAVGSMVARAIGVENSPEAVDAALAAQPDLFLKLKELENTHRERLEALALRKLDLELKDGQNARQIHANHWMPSAMTLILAVMASGIVAALYFKAVPAESKDLFNIVAGVILASFQTGVSYWLGTSRTSAVKDQINFFKNEK